MENWIEKLREPAYDEVGETINRMALRFDQYVEIYPEALEAYKRKTDGDDADFFKTEYRTIDEVLQFTEQLYTEEGIDKRSWLWDISESYRPWHKKINAICLINNDTFDSSNRRKLQFLNEKATEMGIELDGVPKPVEEVTASFELKKKLLLLHYLDQHKHLQFNKIHPDKKHLSQILSFIVGRSNNTIYQNISPAGIVKMKETRGVMQSVHDLLTPYREHFPNLISELEEDLKKLPF